MAPRPRKTEAAAVGDGGVWIDTDTGEVVTTQPVNGRLLHTAGDEMTDSVKAALAGGAGVDSID